MKQYQVTGMSCAACSARVEKAVSKVPGVTSCSVSLLTNSMGVEGSAGEQAVIAAVEAACAKEAVKEYLPMQPGDVYQTNADTSALQRDMGYKPSKDIREGIRETVAWFKSYYHLE